MSKVNPIQLQKYLKGVDYPAKKNDLIKHASQQSILTNQVPENEKVSSSLKSKVSGALTHLSIGTIFTFSYYFLWKKELQSQT